MRAYFGLGIVRNAVMRRIARWLKPYLADTPLIWGDPRRLKVGNGVQIVDAVINLSSGTVTIGDDAFCGHGVMLLTGKHSMSKFGQERQAAIPGAGRDIVLGRGVWVASGAIVIGPCDIGENSVIGAGSIVSGSVPAGVFYSGAPAKYVHDIELQPQSR
jgi:acetyltransferase-like isoleucine patch superfamily enzyme